ncbi:MAG: prolyl oligopeptidase family serine peptidase [Paludibaculum sp.]
MRTLLVGLAVVSLLSAAEKWTVDDILLQERASGLQFSRDGKVAVYVKSRMNKEQGEAVSHLYLKRLSDLEEIQLTRGNDSESSPKFSPDGKRIAFLTSRKPPAAGGAPADAAPSGMQVWFLNLAGGEPWSVTKFEKGVRAFEWLDNDALLIAAPEDSSLYDQKVKERKDTSQVVDDEKHAPPVRLFKFEVKGSKSTRLTTNTDRITAVFASPDGAWAVTLHNRSLAEIYDQKVKPVTFLHDLKSGKSTQLFADGKVLPRGFDWTNDSKGFYFSAPYTTHPYLYNASVNLFYHYDVVASKLTKVDLGWENGISSGVSLTPDGFVALLANGARNRVARYTRTGDTWTRSWIDTENVQAVNVTEDGQQIIYTSSTSSDPAKWMLAKLDGAHFTEAKEFLATNSDWKKKPIAKTELVTWKGAQDEQVEGILYYPHNYTAGKKYPLVVMIHGGPHGHDPYAFNESMGYPHQLYAQRGAFLFKPNYHGSSNYGLKWGESISGGKYNDLEWVDVEKGVDSLIARGLIDPDKMGVMGWSNGSIITIELTTRTTRYKVAGAGAGDVNWSSDWGNAVFGDSFEKYYLGKTPMEDPQLYIRKSPLYRMDKVKTPTIIFFGTEDKQVPTEQGWQHYRALQHYGQTDVKFILFPGEAHGPRKYVHQRRKVEEELAWFDKYLFGTASDTNEALKPESALAALLKTKSLPQVPETVERGAIAIGRFEVTRGQFHAFENAYRMAPGTEAWPAGGITADRAKAYCAWLSKQTGQTYRLGTEEELGSLLTRSKSENTLDHWAGYTVNADDEARLSSLIEGMAPGSLLQPVGSFTGSGEDPLFDLGGNVAEWVTKKDGSTAALGGSADRPADAKTTTQARPDYIGFRVVRDLK